MGQADKKKDTHSPIYAHLYALIFISIWVSFLGFRQRFHNELFRKKVEAKVAATECDLVIWSPIRTIKFNPLVKH